MLTAQVHAQIINDLELSREFTVVHAEKLIEEAHLLSRSKRDADEYSDDFGKKRSNKNSLKI